MTPRPRLKDIEIRLIAAEAALPEVIEWLADDYQEEHRAVIIEQLAEAFEKSTDGYDICRHLDLEHGWEPDADLVEILDGQYLWNAEHEAVREWVKNNKIDPLYSAGDVVSFNWYDSTWTAGTIMGSFDDIACYSVMIERKGRAGTYWAVPFEDAQLIPVVPEDVVSEE